MELIGEDVYEAGWHQPALLVHQVGRVEAHLHCLHFIHTAYKNIIYSNRFSFLNVSTPSAILSSQLPSLQCLALVHF